MSANERLPLNVQAPARASCHGFSRESVAALAESQQRHPRRDRVYEGAR